MGMTNYQLKMVRMLAENRIQEAKEAAIVCCIEDTTKKNERYLKNYKALLENGGDTNLVELPYDVKGFLRMEDVSNFRESRYCLTHQEERIFAKIKQTNEVSMRLLSMGIRYLNSTLIYGVPGTGKTMFGRYVAYKLGLPFAYVNFSFLIDSYMGNTSKNLKKVFDFCKGKPCVLMLDEVDCIALARSGDSGGTSGELARATISLMQELDNLTNEQIIIAATNRMDRLDQAFIRRFFQKEELKIFDEADRAVMAYNFLDDVGIIYDKKAVLDYVKEPRTQDEIIKFATGIVVDSIKKEVME